jgi:hypothetical protein
LYLRNEKKSHMKRVAPEQSLEFKKKITAISNQDLEESRYVVMA